MPTNTRKQKEKRISVLANLLPLPPNTKIVLDSYRPGKQVMYRAEVINAEGQYEMGFPSGHRKSGEFDEYIEGAIDALRYVEERDGNNQK